MLNANPVSGGRWTGEGRRCLYDGNRVFTVASDRTQGHLELFRG